MVTPSQIPEEWFQQYQNLGEWFHTFVRTHNAPLPADAVLDIRKIKISKFDMETNTSAFRVHSKYAAEFN